MEDTSATPTTAPEATDVINALANESEVPAGVLEKVTIERVTDAEYMCRVWIVGAEDFEGYHLTF